MRKTFFVIAALQTAWIWGQEPDGGQELFFTNSAECLAWIESYERDVLHPMPDDLRKMLEVEKLSNAIAKLQELVAKEHQAGTLAPEVAAERLNVGFFLLQDHLERLQQYDSALFVTDLGISLNAGTEQGLSFLKIKAMIYDAAGMTGRAIQLLEEIKSNPAQFGAPSTAMAEQADVHRTLAMYYEKQGRFPEAIAAYEDLFQWYLDQKYPAGGDSLESKLSKYEELLEAHDATRVAHVESLRNLFLQRAWTEADHQAFQAVAKAAADQERLIRRQNMLDYWQNGPAPPPFSDQ